MTATTPLPLACNLAALNPEERLRHAQLWRHLRTLAPKPNSTPRGFAFRLQPSLPLAKDLAELAVLEMRCCPFLQISVRFDPADGPLLFELNGGEDVKAFLAAEFQTTGGRMGSS